MTEKIDLLLFASLRRKPDGGLDANLDVGAKDLVELCKVHEFLERALWHVESKLKKLRPEILDEYSKRVADGRIKTK